MKTVVAAFLLTLAVSHAVDVLEGAEGKEVAKRRELLVAVAVIVSAVVTGVVGAVVTVVANHGIDACAGPRRITVVVDDGQAVVGRRNGRRRSMEEDAMPVGTAKQNNSPPQQNNPPQQTLELTPLDANTEAKWNDLYETTTYEEVQNANQKVTNYDRYGDAWDPRASYVVPLEVRGMDAVGNLLFRLPGGAWYKGDAAFDELIARVKPKTPQQRALLESLRPDTGRTFQSAFTEGSEPTPKRSSARSLGKDKADEVATALSAGDYIPHVAISMSILATLFLAYRTCVSQTSSQYQQLMDDSIHDEI